MDVKSAIDLAKRYIWEIFRDDNIDEVALEEVEFDEARSRWRITIGFSRPWEQKSGLLTRGGANRTYKTVEIDDVAEKVRFVKES